MKIIRLLFFAPMVMIIASVFNSALGQGDIETICKSVGQNIFNNTKKDNLNNLAENVMDTKIKGSDFDFYYLERALFSKFNTINPSIAFKLTLGGLQRISFKLQDKLASHTKEGTLEIISNLKNFIKNYMQNFTSNSVWNNLIKFREGTALNIKENEANLEKACISIKPFKRIFLKNTKCKNSIKFLMKEADPKIATYNSSEFIFGHNLNLILNDRNYVRLLSEVAISLLDNFKNLVQGLNPPPDNIFERIEVIALKLGFSKSQAREMTFTLLGTYAIRGAGYYEMLDYEEKVIYSTGPGISLLILSSFISYFDKLNFYKYKRLFSLPSNYMKTTCLYGKPYHFWMSAYLSYLANRKGGYDIETSFNAAHLLGVAYEIAPKKRNSFEARGNYIYSILHAKTSDHVDVHNMKLDLVFNSLGAGFGLWQNKQGKIDADKVLEKSFQSGARYPISLLPAKLISVPSTLYLIIDPHSYIDLIKKVILPLN